MTTIRTRAAKGSALSATEYDDAVKRTPVAKSSNYTLDASHNREVHELGGSITTVTLPVVSSSFTETDDWSITLINLLEAPVTIGRNGQTIDGGAADVTLNGREKVTIYMNSTFDGFHTDRNLWGIYYACRAYKTADQANLVSSTWTDLTFDSESFDSGTIHSTSSNTELFVAPAWATKAKISAQVAFEANTTGPRGIRIVTSAGALLTPHISTLIPAVSAAGFGTFVQINTGLFTITGGSSYKMQAYQASGAALDVLGSANETWISIEFYP